MHVGACFSEKNYYFGDILGQASAFDRLHRGRSTNCQSTRSVMPGPQPSNGSALLFAWIAMERGVRVAERHGCGKVGSVFADRTRGNAISSRKIGIMVDGW